MAVSSAAQQWNEMLDETGIDMESKRYLQARLIERVGTVASIAKDVDDFHVKVTEKFLAGHDVGGTNYKYSGDADVLRAWFAHLYTECSAAFQKAHANPALLATASASAGMAGGGKRLCNHCCILCQGA